MVDLCIEAGSFQIIHFQEGGCGNLLISPWLELLLRWQRQCPWLEFHTKKDDLTHSDTLEEQVLHFIFTVIDSPCKSWSLVAFLQMLEWEHHQCLQSTINVFIAWWQEPTAWPECPLRDGLYDDDFHPNHFVHVLSRIVSLFDDHLIFNVHHETIPVNSGSFLCKLLTFLRFGRKGFVKHMSLFVVTMDDVNSEVPSISKVKFLDDDENSAGDDDAGAVLPSTSSFAVKALVGVVKSGFPRCNGSFSRPRRIGHWSNEHFSCPCHLLSTICTAEDRC